MLLSIPHRVSQHNSSILDARQAALIVLTTAQSGSVPSICSPCGPSLPQLEAFYWRSIILSVLLLLFLLFLLLLLLFLLLLLLSFPVFVISHPLSAVVQTKLPAWPYTRHYLTSLAVESGTMMFATLAAQKAQVYRGQGNIYSVLCQQNSVRKTPSAGRQLEVYLFPVRHQMAEKNAVAQVAQVGC